MKIAGFPIIQNELEGFGGGYGGGRKSRKSKKSRKSRKSRRGCGW